MLESEQGPLESILCNNDTLLSAVPSHGGIEEALLDLMSLAKATREFLKFSMPDILYYVILLNLDSDSRELAS